MSSWESALKYKLAACEDFEQCMDVLFLMINDLGFTQVVYATQDIFPKIGENKWLPLKLNVRNFPEKWEQVWVHFEEHDPYYHACFDGTLPFEWKSVQQDENLNFLERQAWKYLADLGLQCGMTVPIHHPGGSFSVVSAILDKTNVSWKQIYDNNHKHVFFATHLFNDMVTKKGFVSQAKKHDQVFLSPREKECLSWVSKGKTTPEIAIILDLSKETVRLHIKNSMTKLDAVTRTHAVSKAFASGQITYRN